MPDKRIFIAYNTAKGNILKEKFTQDAFFTVSDIQTEEEYNKTFLKYREKLLDITKTIRDVALKEYGKKILDLNFVVQNISAFYINNEAITIFDIEKNIDLLAWFFVSIDKIKDTLGVTLTLKNIKGFKELAKIKEAVAEKNIPLFDLWQNIVGLVTKKSKYSRLYEVIYPQSSQLLDADAIVIYLKSPSAKDVEDSFVFFTDLMKATNKNKSCQLCIFNNYETYKEYLKNNHMFVIVFNPRLGFLASHDKKGLIAHIISIDRETDKVKEIADYMNDHNVTFPASLDMLKEIDLTILERIDPSESNLERLNLFIDSLKKLEKHTGLKEIGNIINIINLVEKHFRFEDYGLLSESSVEIMKDSIRKRILLKIIQNAFYENIDKDRLLEEIKNYILDFESLRKDIGESNFNKIIKNYENIILTSINERLYSLLEEDSKLKTILKAKEKDREGKISKLFFESTLEIPGTDKKFVFDTTLSLENKKIYEIINRDPQSGIVSFDIGEISSLLKEENVHVFSDEKIQEIANIIADQSSKESFSLEKLNPIIKSHFINLINSYLSALLLKEIKKNSLGEVISFLKQEKQVNEITSQILIDHLLRKIESESEKEVFAKFIKELVSHEDVDSFQKKIDEIDQEIKRTKDLVGDYFYNKSLTAFYTQSSNWFKTDINESISLIKKIINIVSKVKESVSSVINNFYEKDIEDFTMLNKIVDKVIAEIANLKNFRNDLEKIYSNFIALAYRKIKEQQKERFSAVVKNYIIETICFDICNIITKE